MNTKIDFNAPAFGPNASKFTKEEESTADTPTVVPQAEEEVEKKVEAEPSLVEDEQKVPYSRFSKIHREKIEAERVAQEYQEKYEELSRRPQTSSKQEPEIGNLPSWWTKLYGDNEPSREAYKFELERQSIIKEEARKEAVEAVRNERVNEVRQVNENVSDIDSRLEDLSASIVGRDLTDNEQAALLEIVDDYTPKDRDGNYAGELLPFDKAWEIYEMKKNQSSSARNKSRNAVTSLTSTRSNGEDVSNRSERDKNFNPLNWNFKV